MSDEEDDWKPKKSETEGEEEEPPSLTPAPPPMPERISDASGSRKRSSVKFADELNDLVALEGKYEELMRNSLENPPPFITVEGEPELVDAVDLNDEREQPQIEQDEMIENLIVGSPPPTPAPESRPQRKSIAEQIEDKEITAEDIFNEIKVARASNPDQVIAPAQNLHSYIISKSRSSENVVVLLNLRRMKDGEWILDKTIAQGMRPETYGGVVSIDKYGFSEPAVNISNSPSVTAMRQMEHDRELTEILKRIEQYIAAVSRKVDNMNAGSVATCPEAPPPPSKKFEYATCEAPVTYEDLSVMDQCLRMLYALAPEDSDPCSICTGSEVDSSDVIDKWIDNMLANVGEFSMFSGKSCNSEDGPPVVRPSQVLPGSMTVLEQAEAQRSALISQSKALLEQVQSHKTALLNQSMALLDQVQNTKSALMDKFSTALLPSAKKSEPASEPPPEQPVGESITNILEPPAAKNQDDGEEDKDDYQINIEADVDVDDFVRQHQD